MELETSPANRITDEEALELHALPKPGKLEIVPSKKLTTQRDLALAYSPGVAVPCLKIYENPDAAYDYTAKGNMVAVISNGTAVLGLGNLGALASKPVMEGKAVLFKRFADVDSIDIEVSTENVDEFINCVKFLGASWGGINLEDIRAPDCFIIEQALRETLDIPVFHDDQHGTAIIAVAGLINALDLTGRDIKTTRVVMNGAGAAAIACAELIKAMGLPHDHLILCDSQGVIYAGRAKGMNQWKSAHAVDTPARTLTEALKGADVFFGLSVKGAVTADMVAGMAARPLIFAMANPDPEITPEEVRQVRKDAIVATGRSDYPNQINNVLGFPYIFRGALDVRASTINDAMKIAAAKAIAGLAREDVPDEVDAAYAGQRLRYGPEYIIPVPFDPRLISTIPVAVAKAAMDSGVARRPIADLNHYREQLRARVDPSITSLQAIFEAVKKHPRRVVFAEGEEEKTIRAALAFKNAGYGTPVLVENYEGAVAAGLQRLGQPADALEAVFPRKWARTEKYVQSLYTRLQRQGFLLRDCQRMAGRERNIFAASMVAHGDADALVTGLTRNFSTSYADISKVIEPASGKCVFGLMIAALKSRTVFIADTAVNELPSPEELARITIQTAEIARRLGHVPRVALLSFSNFGNPMRERAARVREAVAELDRRHVDFEYDGEMTADVALNPQLLKLYPFCRLTGPANVLIMPALHTAHVASKLLQTLGDGTVIGPLLVGLDKPVQIVPMGATVSDVVTQAVFAAHSAAGG
jgi:malate dehydrogenase (oxaloacetate-decarboxylating)(NADP+)